MILAYIGTFYIYMYIHAVYGEWCCKVYTVYIQTLPPLIFIYLYTYIYIGLCVYTYSPLYRPMPLYTYIHTFIYLYTYATSQVRVYRVEEATWGNPREPSAPTNKSKA